MANARTKKASLAETHPKIAAQWDYEKNFPLTPNDVTFGVDGKFHWKCSSGHEWIARIISRIRSAAKRKKETKSEGCPECSRLVRLTPSLNKSLADVYPEKAAYWDDNRNPKELSPETVNPGANEVYSWRCVFDPSHIWKSTIKNFVRRKTPCQICKKIRGSFAYNDPDHSAMWAYDRNGEVIPENVSQWDRSKYWLRCPKDPDHLYQRSPHKIRTGVTRCPHCSNLKLSSKNWLLNYPKLVEEWDYERNYPLEPKDIVEGSSIERHWICSVDPNHRWKSQVYARVNTFKKGTRQYGTSAGSCLACRNRILATSNSLFTVRPDLAMEWDYVKNDPLTPKDVIFSSTDLAWWNCPENHSYEHSPNNRHKLGYGCTVCRNRVLTPENSLAVLRPDLAAEWHPTLNEPLTPYDVIAGGRREIWWKCSLCGYVYKSSLSSRISHGTGCRNCNWGWTVEKIRHFVKSLLDGTPPITEKLTPAERYAIFEQSGLIDSYGKSRSFIKALATGRFPLTELEKFVNQAPSLVDDFIADSSLSLEELHEIGLDELNQDYESSNEKLFDMPELSVSDVLNTYESDLFASVDEEVAEYLVTSGVSKIWEQIYEGKNTDFLSDLDDFSGQSYGAKIKDRFLNEYHAAIDLHIPPEYNFRLEGQKITPPNLMQRHAASLVRDRHRVGNWSGTGSGKTLSAVLASRIIDARLTLICCPNSVVEGWKETIKAIFPDSEVNTKDWNPNWTGLSSFHYLIMNYEQFQLGSSASNIRSLLKTNSPDFIVVDEIHFAKRTNPTTMSKRREMVNALIANAGSQNPSVRILGMSATPVINNLREGRSLIELITNREYEDLETGESVPNAMKVHQHLSRLGLRWMPDYSPTLIEERPEIDCGDYVDEIRVLGKHSLLPLETILTKAKLPLIRERIKPKTLIYSFYKSGIKELLDDALTQDGWKVGFYDGDDKTGLLGFIEGDLDVLIGTSAVGTGLDGIQNVCDQLIINVLPWTAAEYDQLKGRIYRQGQTSEAVTVIIPTTFAEVNGERWSWCDSKWNRVKFKKSLADAAVDGVVPEGHLRSPNQAYSDAMKWLDRLSDNRIVEINRPEIIIPLADSTDQEYQRRLAHYGDFSRINNRWNSSNSSTTHYRLTTDKEEWEYYHSLLREHRKDWAVDPLEEMAKYLSIREGYAIGDFGCGEGLLAEKLSGKCTVHSFDHVSSKEFITDCDISNVPLDNEELDVAVFCLSLMGRNFTDYLKESHRTLKLDGMLHIYEATSRFKDLNAFEFDLRSLGFSQISIEEKGVFTHIIARKDVLEPSHPIERIRGLG